LRRLLAPAVLFLIAASGVGTTRADVGPLSRITGTSPFAANCNGAPQIGTLFRNAEVEPWVSANPANPRNLVAVYQQDRWSNGGAQGDLTSFSFNRGRSWHRPTPPPFTRCAGGNAANGGNYERASDPWVSFGPHGSAHQIALALAGPAPNFPTSAVLVSSSRDGGRSWGPIKTLQRDTTAQLANDKESITADPTNARFVYAVWDRLQAQNPADPNSPLSGDTLFARSTDGGRTWEPTRTILDFPDNSNIQTLGNQIVVLGNGTVVDAFDLIDHGVPYVAVQRSTNRGRSWSHPAVVDILFSSAARGQGVIDPSDGHPVRTGDLLPEAAADPRRGSRTLYLVWQDVRFARGAPLAYFNDQIVLARSRDGGRSWSDRKRVSSNRRTQAFTGSVEVNQRGNLGVTYCDFTFDHRAGPLDTDYWSTESRDGGRTFARRERLTRRSFDMRSAPDAEGFDVGDYEGLTSAGRRFLPVFVAANSGDLANRTDAFSSSFRRHFVWASASTRTAPASAGVSGRRLGGIVKDAGQIRGPVRVR
jgi:hypothetical protein